MGSTAARLKDKTKCTHWPVAWSPHMLSTAGSSLYSSGGTMYYGALGRPENVEETLAAAAAAGLYSIILRESHAAEYWCSVIKTQDRLFDFDSHCRDMSGMRSRDGQGKATLTAHPLSKAAQIFLELADGRTYDIWLELTAGHKVWIYGATDRQTEKYMAASLRQGFQLAPHLPNPALPERRSTGLCQAVLGAV
ncbi:hypothetical protein RRG08_021470 [Elysia crispata]|uniref:Uncharacterized protein n=1 Tax=Elysia crispata TaxID=231223 RepID=A0AAE1DXB2_9GAST|nr:hypothetical protein RRG08_021470 [Elysia crispata]